MITITMRRYEQAVSLGQFKSIKAVVSSKFVFCSLIPYGKDK